MTFSDNSVFAQVGIKVGTRKVARLAAPHGHPHAGLAQLRDDARRPQAGRDAARHGARLRDVRQRRQAHLRHAEPGRATTRATRRPGPGRHRARSAAARTASQAGRAARRRRGGQPQAHAQRCSTHASPTEVGSMLQTRRPARHRHARAGPGHVVIAGKTGTTEDYGDAWFVGWTHGVHGRRLGRLPGRVQADGDRVPGRSRSRAAPTRPRSSQTFIEARPARLPETAEGREDDRRRRPRRRRPRAGADRRAAPARRRRAGAGGDGDAPATAAAPRRAARRRPAPARPRAADRAADGAAAAPAADTGAGRRRGRPAPHGLARAARAARAARRCASPARAEAPRQLGRLGDPDPRRRRRARRRSQPGGGGPIADRARPRGRCR